VTALSLAGVAVRRGRRTALQGVDLEVQAGELLVVVGPNGSGKSTLLGVLAGDLRPSRGTATLEGRALVDWRPRDLATRRAVVVQEGSAAFGFTVREVVAMGRAPWPVSPDDASRVDDSLAVVDLTALADVPVTQLSGGERARVELARALCQDTPVLLLDEPTAALDLRHAHQAMAHVRDLARAGRAVVAVVHDVDLAALYADRVVVLDGGAVVGQGSPEQVLTSELLSRVYGTPVAVVLLPGSERPRVVAGALELSTWQAVSAPGAVTT